MARVLLVHWQEQECAQRAARLQRLGFEVVSHWRAAAGGELTRALTKAPPDAVVIDLGRLPAHGRAVAVGMRQHKTLRHVPIVCVAGDAAKTARLRETLPDAVYATWPRLAAALRRALVAPPLTPIVPSRPDYSGTPLAKKLGLGSDGRLGVVRAPADFGQTLGELPAGAKLSRRLVGDLQVIVLFCRVLVELRADWPAAEACLASRGGLWVAWPKKASGQTTDLSDAVVRAFGLDRGLVDTKVCAIDGVWSALRFSRRRS